MKKYFLFVLMFFILSFSKVFATDYFVDDFNQKDNTKWNYIQKQEELIFSDGVVDLGNLRYLGAYFPFFITNNDIFPKNKDWTLEIRFKFRNADNNGDGIGIGFTGINDSNLYFQFGVWNDLYNGFQFYYNDFSDRTNKCTNFAGIDDLQGRENSFFLNFNNNVWHLLKIRKDNDKYSVFIDETNVYTSKDNQCVPNKLWFGNMLFGGSFWSGLSVDYVRLYDGMEVANPKIIILPGLGASWNTNAIVNNKTVGDNDWKMTPFVKNYDGLITALKNNGLEENKDFYVWNYDWRRPVSEIETKLNNFINEKIKNDEKVILIGHSLGGLVARVWAEDNKSDPRLEKVINLGSPNLGSVDSYEIWNGGQISNLKNISGIAFKILLEIRGLSYKSDMEAARKNIPVLKDLLPTFDFISKNEKNMSNDKLETNNSFLISKNNNSGVGSTLKLFAGNGFKTTEIVKLKDNNAFDKFLGIWPDGRIDGFNYSNSGDGTVLIKSANYGKNDFVQLNSNHGEIVGKSVNLIMSEIGLTQVELANENQNLDNNLVFFVGSPANYSIKCDNENPVNDQDGFVMIKNNNYKSCEVKLMGTGDGVVHVVSGNTNDEDWNYWEKNINKDEVISIKISPNNGHFLNDTNNISLLKLIIKKDIDSLIKSSSSKDLKEALKYLEKDKPRLVIKSIFEFRKNNKERFVSGKVIDNTTMWLSLTDKCSKPLASNGFRMVKRYEDLINSLMSFKNNKEFNINEDAAISYQQMDNFLKESKNNLEEKEYNLVCAENLTALKYGNEVLFMAHRKNGFEKWLLEDSDL